MRQLMKLGVTAAMLALLPLTATAEVLREEDEYVRLRVLPGERISQDVDCPRGELTGGGYRLSGAEADAAFLVLANYPLADGRWRVDVRNQSDQNQPLTLWVYALCMVE